MKKIAKRYLGDGVYVDYDGYYIVLTTENGINATNTIYLERPVLDALTDYMEELVGIREHKENNG